MEKLPSSNSNSLSEEKTNEAMSVLQPQQQSFEFEVTVYKDGEAMPFLASERALIHYPALLDFFKYHGKDFNQICQKSVNSSGYSGDIESQSGKEDTQDVMVRGEVLPLRKGYVKELEEIASATVSDVDNLTGLKEETKEVASSSDSEPAAVNPTGLREECDDSPDSDIEIIYRGRAELVTDSEDEEPEPGSPEFLKVPNYDYDTSEESE